VFLQFSELVILDMNCLHTLNVVIGASVVRCIDVKFGPFILSMIYSTTTPSSSVLPHFCFAVYHVIRVVKYRSVPFSALLTFSWLEMIGGEQVYILKF
jgi:hypothetical protein